MAGSLVMRRFRCRVNAAWASIVSDYLRAQTKSWTATSEKTIDAAFVAEQLERFSFSLEKLTVVVLDNTRIHTGKKMGERIGAWQQRGLFVFYLPIYSPHLNIAETIWRKLKYEWLAAEDYESKGHLQYAVSLALLAFGKKPENQVFRLQT